MSSLFVKGMILKSADESCLPTRLKQRRTGDHQRLNHHQRQPPFVRWVCGGIEAHTGGGSVPIRAVLNPVSPPVVTTKKRVFTFGKGRSDGNKDMKSLLGGKGANLAEMASIGLSVPPGLTISTEACDEYQQSGKKLPPGLWDEILEGLQFVQKEMGASLSDPSKALLLSVRSGASEQIFLTESNLRLTQ